MRRYQFHYDLNGLYGFTWNSHDYLYEKDALGNIIGIHMTEASNGSKVVTYDYDARGMCTEKIYADSEISDIVKYNPFRWKGYYFDIETGLYYITSIGRYYDPETGRFINDNLSGMAYNVSGYAVTNPIALSPSNFNCSPSLPLTPEFKKGESDWLNDIFKWYNDLHWGWKIGVGTGLFLAGLGLTVATGGAVLPFTTKFTFGVAVGTAIGAGINLVMGENFDDALLDGFADSVLFSGIFSFGSGVISAGKYGYAYATRNAEIMAKLFTHNPSAASYMLGKWDNGGVTGYIAQAKAGGHTYFAMPKRIYTSINARFAEGAWSVNKAFLMQQAGKTLWVSHSIAAATNTFLREIEFLLFLGI